VSYSHKNLIFSSRSKDREERRNFVCNNSDNELEKFKGFKYNSNNTETGCRTPVADPLIKKKWLIHLAKVN